MAPGNTAGAVELAHEGQVYYMTLNMGAGLLFEAAADRDGAQQRNFFAALSLFSRGGVAAGLLRASDLCRLVYAGLKVNHPGAEMTMELAAAILDSNAEKLVGGIREQLPKDGDLTPEDGDAPGKVKRPKRHRAK